MNPNDIEQIVKQVLADLQGSSAPASKPAASVPATSRVAMLTELEHFDIKELYSVDAKAWHGNSGGALFDSKGQLIGIVTLAGSFEGLDDGQTYALKISKVKSILSGKGFQL